MDADVRDIVEECTKASDDGRVSFGEVVLKLMEAGVERYHTDLIRAEKTYYMPDGESHFVAGAAIETIPATAFSAASVEAAVRAIQGGQISYKEFCEHIAAAGCVGYFVSLAGRRAVYYGRTGDFYVEPFPAAQ